MWSSTLIIFFLSIRLINTENSCPEVKVVGLGDSDKLTILRGCPGIPGSPGPKGDTGPSGDKGLCPRCRHLCVPGWCVLQGLQLPTLTIGQIGAAGKSGPQGEKGHHGEKGNQGEKGEKGEFGPGPDSLYAARNCKELLDQGIVLSDWYTIYPDGKTPLKVLCDMHTDEGGWIVFQRRWDGSVDFFRDWKSYKTGFGSRLNEFWLGNDNLHMITSAGKWELRVDLQDVENTKYFAKYDSFQVLAESEKYKLLLGAFTGGNAGDSLISHRDMKFSTKDQDNDIYSLNCAELFKGGWWYDKCHYANLNGLYLLGQHATGAIGINWYYGKGYSYSYKYSEMKIRPL